MADIEHLVFKTEEEHVRFMTEEGLPLLALYRGIRDRELRGAVKAVLQSIADADAKALTAHDRSDDPTT